MFFYKNVNTFHFTSGTAEPKMFPSFSSCHITLVHSEYWSRNDLQSIFYVTTQARIPAD